MHFIIDEASDTNRGQTQLLACWTTSSAFTASAKPPPFCMLTTAVARIKTTMVQYLMWQVLAGLNQNHLVAFHDCWPHQVLPLIPVLVSSRGSFAVLTSTCWMTWLMQSRSLQHVISASWSVPKMVLPSCLPEIGPGFSSPTSVTCMVTITSIQG